MTPLVVALVGVLAAFGEPNKRAVVMIMVAKHDDYVRGQNLRRRVMQLNDLDEQQVVLWCPKGYPLAGKKNILTVDRYPISYHAPKLARRWETAIHKMALFGETQYNVIVSMDLDMVPAQRFTELFHAPALSITYGMEGHTYPYGINSGLIVIYPNATLYRWIKHQPQHGADQDIIAQLLLKNNELVLSHIYNMNPSACNALPDAFGPNQYKHVKIWHFTNDINKPWQLERDQVPKCARDAWSKLYAS